MKNLAIIICFIKILFLSTSLLADNNYSFQTSLYNRPAEEYQGTPIYVQLYTCENLNCGPTNRQLLNSGYFNVNIINPNQPAGFGIGILAGDKLLCKIAYVYENGEWKTKGNKENVCSTNQIFVSGNNVGAWICVKCGEPNGGEKHEGEDDTEKWSAAGHGIEMALEILAAVFEAL